MLYPPPVLPGDRLRIVAPSGPFDKTLFYQAIAWLERRYRVVWEPGILEQQGYLAGPDRRRLDELDRALRDPEARAVIGVRGGYGATRICPAADFTALARHPKWCVGFSDFTALHLEAMRVGVASLHAANLGELGRGDEVTRTSWLQAIENPLARRCFSALSSLCPGRASGPIFGGNLTLLFTAAASGQWRLPRGSLLFFEDVNEAPYRIDRMLTALSNSGRFESIAGFCVGTLTADGDDAAQNAAWDTVVNCLAPLGVPVLAGLPVGHGRNNQPLPLGVPAVLDTSLGSLILNPNEADLGASDGDRRTEPSAVP